MTNLDEAIIETQALLGNLFVKPKCSKKHLAKPPFRFIHDIILAIIDATGFPNNYFSKDELDSKKIKEKSAKINFLKKLIRLVEVSQGFDVDLRPSKVVAGLEPIKTNIFLLQLGKVATDDKLNRKRAIEFCLQGGNIEKVGYNELFHLDDEKKVTPKKQDENVISRNNPDLTQTQQDRPELQHISSVDHQLEDLADFPNKDIKLDSNSKENISNSNVSNNQLELPKQTINDQEKLSDHRNIQQMVGEEIDGKSIEHNKLDSMTLEKTEDQTVEKADSAKKISFRIKDCNYDYQQTKRMFNTFVKKPKCTEKLLAKPPFRFLHDLIMSLNRATVFGLENILSPDEMNSSTVKDKKSKLTFLEKIVGHVEALLDTSIDIKLTKVISGLEADKTNKFLQLLVVAASSKTKSENHEDDANVNSEHTQEVLSSRNKILSEHSVNVNAVPIKDEKSVVISETGDEKNSYQLSSTDREKNHFPAGISGDQINQNKRELAEVFPEENKEDELNPISKKQSSPKNHIDSDSKRNDSEPIRNNGNNRNVIQKIEDVTCQLGVGNEIPSEQKNQKIVKHMDELSQENEKDEAISSKPKIIPCETKPINEKDTLEVPNNDAIFQDNSHQNSHEKNSNKKEAQTSQISFSQPYTEETHEIEDTSIPYNQMMVNERPKTARQMPPRIRELNNTSHIDVAFNMQSKSKPVIILDGESTEQEENEADRQNEKRKKVVIENNGEKVENQNLDDKTHQSNSGNSLSPRLSVDNDLNVDKKNKHGTLKLRTKNNFGNLPNFSSTSSTPNIQNIREIIQRLAKVAMPIGTRLDRIQLYLSQMGNEKDNWKYGAAQYLREIEESKRKKEITVGKHEKKIIELEENITEIKRKIKILKGKIHRNDDWIKKRLEMICFT